MREFKPISVYFMPDGLQAVVFLYPEDGVKGNEDLLTIVIGFFEGTFLLTHLYKETPPRPMTHQLIINIMKQFGANIAKVVITGLKNGIFYSNIHCAFQGQQHVLDSRPSDAMVLAAITGAPIYIEEEVIRKHKNHVQFGRLDEVLKEIDPAKMPKM